MRPLNLLFFLTLLQHLSCGQTKEIEIVDRETIKRNKIHKCLEYDFIDSIVFFKSHKNGLYTFFDTEGRKIEQNFYTSAIGDETKIIYSYDKSGRLQMWFWYQENIIPKIYRTHIEKYDSTGRKVGYCNYSPNYNESCDSYRDINHVIDSVITKSDQLRCKTFLTFSDSSKKDTIFWNSYFYVKDRLDSNVLIWHENGKFMERLTTKYFYVDGKLNRTDFSRHDGLETTETNSTYYLRNGLLERIETIRYYFATKNSKPRIDKDYRKFVYSYWK